MHEEFKDSKSGAAPDKKV